jgi:hypothetical protein
MRLGDGAGEITDAYFTDEHGTRTELLQGGSRASFTIHVRFNHDVENPVFAVGVENSHRDTVFSATTQLAEPHSGLFHQGEEVTVRFTFDNVLAPDRYTATPSIARAGSGMAWIDWRERMVEAVVSVTRATAGVVNLPVDIDVRRGAREEASA